LKHHIDLQKFVKKLNPHIYKDGRQI